MMKKTPPIPYQTKQWRMLLVYNLYRLASIVVLFSVFWLEAFYKAQAGIYISALVAYFMYGLLFLYFGIQRRFKFEQQIFWAGTVDIVVVIILIHEIGYIESALGILLYVYIAILSILMPGRRAAYFAALACCSLFAISMIGYVYALQRGMTSPFSIGVYGVGFFATALTAWYLASLVRSSEHLAQYRSKELASVHRLNEYIVERLQYGVIYVDPHQKVRVMNEAARQLLNLNRQAGGAKLAELSKPLYEKYQTFLTKIENNIRSAQTTLSNPYLQVHFFSAGHIEQPAVLIIIDDMTHIAQQAQQLKLASLGRFSASIAHEIRNPLGVISHAVQLLGEDIPLNQEDERLKQLIYNNCLRMDKVIKNVLQMSKRQKVSPETIKLGAFLNQFKRDYCLINHCNINIEWPKGGRETLAITFDKTQLDQVLIILCDNALQHGCDESGNVSVTMQIYKDKKQVVLTLCDAGPGIPVSIQSHIFDPFFTTLEHGNGMGLFIAKDLCEMNQARIELLDNQEGCCFSIRFNQGYELKL